MAVKKKAVKKVVPANMSDEEIEAYNEAESARIEKRKRQQDINKRKAKPVERDTTVIRGIKGKDRVRVKAVRKIGISDTETCDIGEVLDIPREIAKKLQEVGAITIAL